MTTREPEPSALSDEELERRLFSKERVVAFFVALLFLLLLAFPGREAFLAWDHTTVAVIADAATAAAAVGIPAAIIYGGRDLVVWIARIVVRALKPADRPITRPGTAEYRQPSRFTLPTLKVARGAWRGVGVIATLIFVVWLGVAGFDAMQRMFAQTEAVAEAPQEQDDPAEAATSDEALPSFCGTVTGEVVCTASADVNSAEELGIRVCGRRGLGREIFDANRDKRGFRFDEFHVPPGTAFSVSCPATN